MIYFFITLYEHAQYHYSCTQTQFYEFLDIMCCISLNMHITQSLLIFKFFQKRSQMIWFSNVLSKNAVFITVYHVKDVQDDISAKVVPIHDCITQCEQVRFLKRSYSNAFQMLMYSSDPPPCIMRLCVACLK